MYNILALNSVSVYLSIHLYAKKKRKEEQNIWRCHQRFNKKAGEIDVKRVIVNLVDEGVTARGS